MTRHDGRMDRRGFLLSATSAGVVLARSGFAADPASPLLAGEGTTDITPPLGIEMGGFHRAPGNERRIKAIRQPPAARALVLEMDGAQVAVCSLDVPTVGQDMAARIQAEVNRTTGIPAENVRICTTHTHSMPAFNFLRQWGALPKDFMPVVERKTVEAVAKAKADLAPSEVLLGKARVPGGNHNRTTKNFKTDERFEEGSTDAERWLDTMLHALIFRRPGQRTLCWYHFSAHAVCFADESAGPDWPGLVAELVSKNEKLQPSFLQGHCGDVNPGDGRDWRGEANQTTAAIYPALKKAIADAAPLKVDCLKTVREEFRVPLDMALFKSWLDRYQADPKKCVGGEWVDAGFAEDWYRGNAERSLDDTHLPVSVSAIRLGPIGFFFHPAELYSYYGLAIRRGSPLPDTLVVGYTDGIIGYLCDPTAYKAGEYAATTVPKILDYPPFTPTAAREMTAAAIELLKRTMS